MCKIPHTHIHTKSVFNKRYNAVYALAGNPMYIIAIKSFQARSAYMRFNSKAKSTFVVFPRVRTSERQTQEFINYSYLIMNKWVMYNVCFIRFAFCDITIQSTLLFDFNLRRVCYIIISVEIRITIAEWSWQFNRKSDTPFIKEMREILFFFGNNWKMMKLQNSPED